MSNFWNTKQTINKINESNHTQHQYDSSEQYATERSTELGGRVTNKVGGEAFNVAKKDMRNSRSVIRSDSGKKQTMHSRTMKRFGKRTPVHRRMATHRKRRRRLLRIRPESGRHNKANKA